MALSANSVFEVRTAGNDTNGGGFVAGAAGTDYSQQDGKNTVGNDISTTDAVANGTTTITSATANFETTIVGNIIYLQGGTGGLAAGWYQVTARASTTSITVDRTVAAGTGITMNIGGALASPGMAGGVGLVSGNIIYIKAGTYTITSASTNVSNGCFSSSLTVLIIQGYQNTRGDFGTAPLLQASGISTFTILQVTGPDATIANFDVDGATLTSSKGIIASSILYKCRVFNCTNIGFDCAGATLVNCLATGCTTASPAITALTAFGCVAHDNTVGGFTDTNCVHCISESNSGASSDGFLLSTADGFLINCVAYNNGRDGARITNDTISIHNTIFEANAGFGINITNRASILMFTNGFFNNTSGPINAGTGKGIFEINSITGTGTFFTNAAGLDFTLNNVAGGGASARSVGFPGSLFAGGTGYLDIGALQHLGIPFFAMIGADIVKGLFR